MTSQRPPVTSRKTSDVSPKPPVTSYHQYLSRPAGGSSRGLANPIRNVLGIGHTNVRNLSFTTLWDGIKSSLDFSHDSAKLMRDAESSGDAEGRNFVLAVCGDLRERSPRNTSWP
jgi:hypothetical protein